MPERPYLPHQPSKSRSAAELRAAIPGWGVDLDPADRPSVPRESFDLPPTGAHWEFPAQQRHEGYREKSIEHARLTPVFGTVAPLHGLSGRIRRLAYDRFSEARAAHWLLLILGDRVESAGSQLRSFASLRPDNPITETGVLAEFRRGGLRSRFGRGRVDLAHSWIDPVLIAAPYVIGAVILVKVGGGIARRLRKA